MKVPIRLLSAFLALVAVDVRAYTPADFANQFPRAERAAMPIVAASNAFKQCSRDAPRPTGKYWLPSERDIDELERRLAIFLADSEKKNRPRPPSAVYRRQYVGYIENGKRHIYANVFDKRISELDSRQVVIICDGGPAIWGIAYDVEAGTFQPPSFNGSI